MIVYGLLEGDTKNLRYIGITTRSLSGRIQNHINESVRDNKRNYKAAWIRKLRRIGVPIEAVVLAECTSIEELRTAERLFIEHFMQRGFKLVNLTLGGDGCLDYYRSVFTPERRARLSELGKQLTGSKNPFYGRKHSDETKAVLREKCKLTSPYVRTERHKRITSAVHKNKKVSPETRKKLSKAVFCITTNQRFESAKNAASVLGVSAPKISACCNGHRHRTGGLEFCFCEALNG